MGITRKTLFGYTVPQRPASANTSRLIPLSQGLQLGTAWPLLPPGSSTSMSNLLPQDGCLVPRSRLSSLNTLRTIETIHGIVERTDSGSLTPEIWVSAATRHGVVASTGSISLASFTSAFGFGTLLNTTGTLWNYAQTFLANVGTGGNNGLVAAAGYGASYDTLLVLYRDANAGAAPFYSYLTSAPKARNVGAFDNYIIAWDVNALAVPCPTRAQWCVRGNPSNWTGEGSGYEDLLEMKGTGTAIRAFADSRFVLFSDREIWQGLSATYPAQFQFLPLDRKIGCANPLTIAETEQGYLFVGSDNALRLLPRAGGPSQAVSGSVSNYLRRNAGPLSSWGVYDGVTKLYHLFVIPRGASTYRGLVVNIETGEWGFMDYPTGNDGPRRGLAVLQGNSQSHTGNEGLYFGNSNGTVFSTSSLLSSDSHGGTVTGAWRSAPIATDLAGSYKQLTKIALDYRATSKSTVTCKISQDGGNNYEATGALMSLTSAPVSGRVELDVYRGGAFPAIELTSTSTGYELHRLDVAMNIGGRK